MLAPYTADGKFYLTDTGDTEVILRIIQPISPPKAEPFKLCLTRVGYGRIEETHDPDWQLFELITLTSSIDNLDTF